MKLKTHRERNLIDFFRIKKIFTILDIILLLAIIVAIVLSLVFTIPKEKGTQVFVYHEGNEIGRYALSSDKEINIIDNSMTIVINDNHCYVQKSNCKNQICVLSKPISKNGERIVCAPNKVTIIIKSNDDVIITGGAL